MSSTRPGIQSKPPEQTQPCPQKIQLHRLVHVVNRKRHKHRERNHLLHDLQLRDRETRSRRFGCRHLQQVFEQRNAPANPARRSTTVWSRGSLAPVPGERREDIDRISRPAVWAQSGRLVAMQQLRWLWLCAGLRMQFSRLPRLGLRYALQSRTSDRPAGIWRRKTHRHDTNTVMNTRRTHETESNCFGDRRRRRSPCRRAPGRK